MKLDINELYHNYIIRVVIFSLFLFKGQIRQPNVFKMSVIAFTKKRLPWKINLTINTVKMDKEQARELILNELLEGVESSYLTTVTVTFTTPLKETTMEVNLKDEEKYKNFLYS